MDFGALPRVDDIDFTLPPDAAQNASVLSGASGRPLQAYMGLPILANSGYIGRLYPKGVPSREYFRLYSQRFNTLEFNTTHYGIPKVETVRHWRDSVPAHFRYCPKVPQSISHSGNLATTRAEQDRYLAVIGELGPVLGTQFIQFPPHFGPERLDELLVFLEHWPAEFPLAVELRDAAWFQPHQAAWLTLQQALAEHKTALVITDVAGRRDVLHMTLAVPEVMVRFNGYGLHATDYARTRDWIARLRVWQARGLERVYFFQHQHEPANSLDMMVYMVKEWNEGGEPLLNLPRLTPPNAQQSLF